jgi:hypothetical protein
MLDAVRQLAGWKVMATMTPSEVSECDFIDFALTCRPFFVYMYTYNL